MTPIVSTPSDPQEPQTAPDGQAPITAPQIVQAAIDGDPAAFTWIFRTYRPNVTKTVRRRLNGSPAADVEDIVSEVFLRAFINITGFVWTGRDIGAWLHTIAVNLVMDYYKHSRRREITYDCQRLLNDEPSILNTETQALSQVHLRGHIRDAIDQLTAQQRQCLALRLGERVSVEESAAALGIAPGAAKGLYFRAIRTLRRILAAKGIAPS